MDLIKQGILFCSNLSQQKQFLLSIHGINVLCYTSILQKKDEVVDTYLEKFHHGITALDGYGGYSHHPVSYLTAVVSSYEVGDVLEALKETDPKIIVSVTKVENFIGRFYNKPLD